MLLLARRAAIAAALVSAAASASAQVTVQGAWVRATIGTATSSAAYFEITSGRGGRLVGVRSPVSSSVDLHEMKMEGDVMRMRAVDAITLPPGQPVALRPNGLHVMITGLKQPLKAGATVPLTLVVEGPDGKREQLEVRATVSATAP